MSRVERMQIPRPVCLHVRFKCRCEPSQTLIKNLDPRVYPVEPVQLPPRNCQPAFIRQAFEMWTILPSFHDEKVKFELSLRLRFQNPKISTILVQRSLQAPIGPIKSVSPNRWTNFIQWDPKSGCNPHFCWFNMLQYGSINSIPFFQVVSFRHLVPNWSPTVLSPSHLSCSQIKVDEDPIDLQGFCDES